MAGRIDRNDGDLARAAVDGDPDAFGALFERHLTAVFEGAWDVVRDRWLAAEVSCEAFEVVWQRLGYLPTDDVAAVLVDVARRAAHDRLATTSPDAGPDVGGPPADVPGGAPTIGPVLHSRIVASLRARGVPVSTGGGGAPSHMRRRRRRLGLPVGATALLAVALGVGFISLAEGDGSGDTVDTDGTQPPSTADDEDDGELTAATRPTSSTSTTTTAPPEEVSTTSSTTEPSEDDAPPGGQGGGPGTTAPPPTTPPQPTTTTSTAPPPPPEPVIVTFDGAMTGRTCNGGLPEIALWWDTENGESARLRPRGGDSMGVPTDGAHLACAEPGTEWILRVENSVGSTTDETRVG